MLKLDKNLQWPFIWKQLAVMIDAGLAIDHALGTLGKGDGQSNKALQRSLGLVKRGSSLADAFKRSRVISEFDYRLLRRAENSGRLAQGLKHIAETRTEQLQRVKSLRASLITPKALLIIGCFAGLFVRVAANGQTMASACFEIGSVMLLVWLITELLLRALEADPRVWLSLLWPLEFVRRISVRFQRIAEQLFYRSFIWQIESGVDAQESVKQCAFLLKSKQYRDSVISSAADIANGQSIPASLQKHGLVLTQNMRQVLSVADAAGVYERAIKHELKIQKSRLLQQREATYKWLPRVYYVVALVVISKFIFS